MQKPQKTARGCCTVKRSIQTAGLLLVMMSLLLGAWAVSADTYVWEDGKLPEGWERITEAEQITATDILVPVNPHASQEAKNLYAYLCSVRESDAFITGMFDMNVNDSMYLQAKQEFGLEPGLYSTHYAVQSLPFSDVSDKNDPCYKKENGGIYRDEVTGEAVIPEGLMTFTDADAVNALAKQHYDNGNILLLHSDEGARKLCPAVLIAKGKYDSPDNAIVELDRTNPDRDMQAYALWYRYQMNQIAALRALEDSGVKAYLLRFWVEFNYEGFHGMDETGEAAFVRVFQQTTQNLIDSGLTGFLITYSPGTGGNTLTRDPGNRYADCYGVTLYSPDTDLGHINAVGFQNYEWFLKTGKPIGFTEFSCRTGIWKDVAGQARGSSFDLLLDAATAYPRLTFVNFWGDGAYSLINNEQKLRNGNDDGRPFLDSPFTLTLNEIPDYRTGTRTAPGVAQVALTTDPTGSYHGLEERTYSLAQLQAAGIDPARIRAVRANRDYAVTFYTGTDCTGTAYTCIGGNRAMTAQTASFRSLRVEAMPNVALEKTEIYASSNDEQAYKANDGNLAAWSGTTDAEGRAWLMLDLERPYMVNHYVVECGGVCGMAAQYNLRDFQLQCSEDGQQWRTVATVSDNTLSKVDAGIETVSARYFRLWITKANSASGAEEQRSVVVSELRLYGMPDLAVRPTPADADPNNSGEDGWTEPEEPAEDGAEDSSSAADDSRPSGTKRRRVVRRTVQTTVWVYVVIAGAAVLVCGGVAFLVVYRKKHRPTA